MWALKRLYYKLWPRPVRYDWLLLISLHICIKGGAGGSPAVQRSARRRSDSMLSVCLAIVPGSVFIAAVLSSSYVVGKKKSLSPTLGNHGSSNGAPVPATSSRQTSGNPAVSRGGCLTFLLSSVGSSVFSRSCWAWTLCCHETAGLSNDL